MGNAAQLDAMDALYASHEAMPQIESCVGLYVQEREPLNVSGIVDIYIIPLRISTVIIQSK